MTYKPKSPLVVVCTSNVVLDGCAVSVSEQAVRRKISANIEKMVCILFLKKQFQKHLYFPIFNCIIPKQKVVVKKKFVLNLT